MEKLTELFAIGGWALYGIALCSILALAIFLERWWQLRRVKVFPPDLTSSIIEAGSEEMSSDTLARLHESSSALGHILKEVWILRKASLVDARSLLQDAIDREVLRLENGVGWLATLAGLAPMLGFLGTVLGMVDMFSNIAAQGEIQDIGVIAGGIYQALYTTIAGLTVAIPITLFHRLLLARVDRLAVDLENTAERALKVRKDLS